MARNAEAKLGRWFGCGLGRGSGGDSQTPWANYDGLIDAVRTAAQGYPGLVTFDLG